MLISSSLMHGPPGLKSMFVVKIQLFLFEAMLKGESALFGDRNYVNNEFVWVFCSAVRRRILRKERFKFQQSN